MTPLPTAGRHLVLLHRRTEGRKTQEHQESQEENCAIKLFLVFPAFLPSILLPKRILARSEKWEREELP